tara:strand:- start:256 stop:546 length:291 start_codon:yes stop_codon:yes gene_type:complete
MTAIRAAPSSLTVRTSKQSCSRTQGRDDSCAKAEVSSGLKVLQKGANTGVGQHFFVQPWRCRRQTNRGYGKKDKARHQRHHQPDKSKDDAKTTDSG